MVPTVSIFIPVYNREKYLPKTLKSLLGQTFEDFEIVLADDGSADGSLAVAYEFAEKDGRIKILEFPHRGEVPTRNQAVKNTHPDAKFLMNHDSDDISAPEKLAKLVALLTAHSEIAVVGCRAEYFDDAGHRLGEPPIECDPQRIRATFGQKNSMIHSTALIRRNVFEKIGSYREKYQSVDDYDFFARALLAGFEMANIPEVLHFIRLHPDSISAKRADKQQLGIERIQAYYTLGQSEICMSKTERLQRRMKFRAREMRAWLKVAFIEIRNRLPG